MICDAARFRRARFRRPRHRDRGIPASRLPRFSPPSTGHYVPGGRHRNCGDRGISPKLLARHP